jgi:membrane protease YdiL (CAAX protease family)
LFAVLFVLGGEALDWVLTKAHLGDRSLTSSGMLWGETQDFLLAAAITWVMSRIGREPFSSYGLPLKPAAARLLLKGLWWGFVPSALILVPIYLAGGCEFHGLALHGSSLASYACLWALAFLAVGFAEEFLFRGYALKTLGEGIGFWPAAVILSSIFGLVHLIFKPHEDWIDPVSVSL